MLPLIVHYTGLVHCLKPELRFTARIFTICKLFRGESEKYAEINYFVIYTHAEILVSASLAAAQCLSVSPCTLCRRLITLALLCDNRLGHVYCLHQLWHEISALTISDTEQIQLFENDFADHMNGINYKRISLLTRNISIFQ